MQTKQPGVEKTYLGYDDIRVYCGLSRWTIARAIRSGGLRAAKVGSRVLVARRDLDEFLAMRAGDEPR